MTKRHLIFITMAILALTLTVFLSGCSEDAYDLEEKNIVTFETNGGILDYGSSSTDENINFAYHPGTYIIDPTEFPNYEITRNGYVFTGWYKTAECNPGDEWDFENTVFTEKTLTLYAGWKPAIKYTYTLYYTNEENAEVKLGTYDVSEGAKFSDWLGYAKTRDGYTHTGFYSDAALSTPWNDAAVHPGGASDLDIPVFVKYIPGEWILVDSFAKLTGAVKQGNVYLTADIDCGGAAFSIDDFNAIFEGNGHKISNFTVSRRGTAKEPASAIFNTIGAVADIKNVTFENVKFDFTGIKSSTDKVTVTPKAAALAINMVAGAKITNVTVTGTLTTDYKEGEITTQNQLFCYKNEADAAAVLAGVQKFNANIIVDKQS